MPAILRCYRGEKTVKLNLLFIGMDLLTLLVYPIVFVYGKLSQFSRLPENIAPGNLLVMSPVPLQISDRRMIHMQKKGS
jgi:hypothetical protein